jgi:hypothetical protein
MNELKKAADPNVQKLRESADVVPNVLKQELKRWNATPAEW